MYVEPLLVDAELVADFPVDEERLLARTPPEEDDRFKADFDCVGRTSLDLEPLPPEVAETWVALESNFPSKIPDAESRLSGLVVNGIVSGPTTTLPSIDMGELFFCPDIVLPRFFLRSSSGSYEARFHVGLRLRVEWGRGPSSVEALAEDLRRLVEGEAA